MLTVSGNIDKYPGCSVLHNPVLRYFLKNPKVQKKNRINIQFNEFTFPFHLERKFVWSSECCGIFQRFRQTLFQLDRILLTPLWSVIKQPILRYKERDICGVLKDRWIVYASVDDPFGREAALFELYDPYLPTKRVYALIATDHNFVRSRIVVHRYIHMMHLLNQRSHRFPILLDFGSLGENGLIYGTDENELEEVKIEHLDRPIVIFQHDAIPLATLTAFSAEGTVPITVALAAGQGIIRVLAELNRAGFVHRCVSPNSFGYSLPLSYETLQYEIVCIEFGMCLEYPVEPRKFAPFVGVPRYASIRAHQGRELGPSDDIISVIYVVVELFTGRLPWRSVKTINSIAEFKLHFAQTSAFKQLPRELRWLYNVMVQTPGPRPVDYSLIIDAFQNAICRYRKLKHPTKKPFLS